MKSFTKTLAIAALASVAFAMPASYAAGESVNPDAFVKMLDMDKDGMVSKAEFMMMMEKMYDKVDKKKMGKIDKKQAESLLMELMKGGGS